MGLLQINQDLVPHVKFPYVRVVEQFDLWKSTQEPPGETWLNTSDIKGTRQTISNTFGREGLRKVSLLAKGHDDARIKYANELNNKEQDYFSNILWSNEYKVE